MVFILLLNRIVFNKEVFKVVSDTWDVSSDKGITFIQKLKKKDIDGPGTFFGLIEFEDIPKSPFFQFEFKTNQEPQTEGQVMHLGFILNKFQLSIYQHQNETYQDYSSYTTFDIHIQKWLFFAFTYEKNSNKVDLILRSNINKFEQIQIVLQQPMNITQQNLLFTFFSKDLNQRNQVLLKSFQFIPQKLQNLQDSIFLLNNDFRQEVFLFQNKRGKNKMIKYSDIKNPANLQIINNSGNGPVKSLYQSDKIFNFKDDNIKNYSFSIKLKYSRSFIQRLKIFRFLNLKNEFLEIFIFENKLNSYIGIQYLNQIQILYDYRLLQNEINQIDIIIQKVFDEQIMILQLQQNNTLKQKVFQYYQIPFEFQNFKVEFYQHLQVDQFQMLKEIKIETNYNFNTMLVTTLMPKKNLQGCKIYQISNGKFLCSQCQHDFKMQDGKCQLQCPLNFNTVNSYCIPCIGSTCDSNLKFSFSVNKIDVSSYLINFNQYKFGLQKNFNDLFEVKFSVQPLSYKTNQIDINKYIIEFQKKRIRNQQIEIKIKNKTLSSDDQTIEYKKLFMLQKNNPDQFIMSISLTLMIFSSLFLILLLLLKPCLDSKIELGYNSFFCIKLFQSYLVLQLFQFMFFMKNNLIIQKEILQEFNRFILKKFSFQLSNNFQNKDFFQNAQINIYMMNFLIIYSFLLSFYIVMKIIHFLLKRQKKKVKQIYSTEVLKKLLIFKKKIKFIINNFEMKIIYWMNLLFSPSLIFFSLRTLKYTSYISQQIIAIAIIVVQVLFILSTYFITIKSKIVLFNTKFNKRYGFLYEGCQILQNYKPLFFSIQLALIITTVTSQYIFKDHYYLYFTVNFCLFLIALSQVIRFKPIFENFWQKEQQCFLMLITAYFGLQVLANINKKIYLKFLDIGSVILINIVLLWNIILLSFYLIKKIKNSSKQKQSDEKGSVIVPARANNSKYKDSQDKKNMFYQSLRKNRRSIEQIKQDKHPRSEQGDQEDLSDQELQSPQVQNSPIKKIGDLAQQKNLKDLYKSDTNSDKTLQNFANNKQRCLIQFPSSDFDNSSDSNYYSQDNYQPELKKSKFYKNQII